MVGRVCGLLDVRTLWGGKKYLAFLPPFAVGGAKSEG